MQLCTYHFTRWFTKKNLIDMQDHEKRAILERISPNCEWQSIYFCILGYKTKRSVSHYDKIVRFELSGFQLDPLLLPCWILRIVAISHFPYYLGPIFQVCTNFLTIDYQEVVFFFYLQPCSCSYFQLWCQKYFDWHYYCCCSAMSY